MDASVSLLVLVGVPSLAQDLVDEREGSPLLPGEDHVLVSSAE